MQPWPVISIVHLIGSCSFLSSAAKGKGATAVSTPTEAGGEHAILMKTGSKQRPLL